MPGPSRLLRPPPRLCGAAGTAVGTGAGAAVTSTALSCPDPVSHHHQLPWGCATANGFVSCSCCVHTGSRRARTGNAGSKWTTANPGAPSTLQHRCSARVCSPVLSTRNGSSSCSGQNIRTARELLCRWLFSPLSGCGNSYGNVTGCSNLSAFQSTTSGYLLS